MAEFPWGHFQEKDKGFQKTPKLLTQKCVSETKIAKIGNFCFDETKGKYGKYKSNFADGNFQQKKFQSVNCVK